MSMHDVVARRDGRAAGAVAESGCATGFLAPGRYQLRGGPRGEFFLLAMDRYRRDRDGRLHYANACSHYSQRWPVLAAFRVRPGAAVTFYGAIGAAERIWRYGQ